MADGEHQTLTLGRWPGRRPRIGDKLRMTVNGEAGWWRVAAADALTMTLAPYTPTRRERLDDWWLDHIRWSWTVRRAHGVYFAIADALLGIWIGLRYGVGPEDVDHGR